jgi:hypothetical protein
MNTRSPTLALLLLALSGLFLSFGCETIAGIEERTLAVDEQGELCTEYCDLVMAGCEGENAVYYRHDACMAVCRTMDIGDLDEAGMTDTLACRLFHADFVDTDPAECVVAGPSGGGVCGDECETYCKFYERVCHPQGSLNPPACVEKCRGLRAARTFDVEAQGSGDTLECRIIHTCNATQNPDVHCPHATLIPPSAGGPCSDKIPPTCEDFCRLTDTACQGEFAVYDSPRQCELACAVFALGDSTNNGTNAAGVTENTIGCRKYHAYVALATPDFHCPHAGPTGLGHCGGDAAICESYCKLAAGACSAEFGERYGDTATCEADCATMEGAIEADLTDAPYRVSEVGSGNNVSCRVLHAVRAFENTQACAAAFGATPCVD